MLGGAALAVLGACGGDDADGGTNGASGDGSPSAQGSDDTLAGPRGSFSLIPFFGGPVLAAGTEVRAPFGLGDNEGVVLGTDGVPEELTFEVRFEGELVGDPITVARRGEEIPRPYFPLRFTPERPGIYDVVTQFDGEPVPAAIQVSDPAEVTLPPPGTPMIPFATPTVDDTRGVDPLCTNDPPCPLHERTLEQVLAAGQPTAFLIATPAYCATAICGPVLDVLLDRRDQFGEQVAMSHAEVFASGAEAASSPGTAETAPVVEAYGLTFEPSLVLADASGTIAERLDFIYDASELTEALERITA